MLEAASPALPTVTVTSVALSKVVEPPRVAVTRAVFAPPSSATAVSTLVVLASASTESVSAVGAASLSVMVPMACEAVAESVALPGDDSLTRKVSLCSERTSSRVATVTVALLSPGAMVKVVAATAV